MRKALLLLVVLSIVVAGAAYGSDHADPAVLKVKEQGITDLFFFPHGDNYIVMMSAFPKLSANPPYKLDGVEYVINFDLHTQLSFTNAADKARYGGTVINPSGIKADASIKYTLNNDATFKSFTTTGFCWPALMNRV